ncbi:MAG: chemotaxis response regulator protein-glutamate methylesterase [Firmicutes bacterium]|nr:chemotaxis response regulator protein-glutamate methylesterase [Bacillota bacterium]
MSKIRVLVVDDSAFMRKVISDLINADPQLEVVGTARNGEEALAKIGQLQPDVVTMDVEMPVMDGLTALDKIMRSQPLPVIMLSSVTQSGPAATMKALEKGAIDFIAKPSGPISLDINQVQNELILKIKTSKQARLTKSSGRILSQRSFNIKPPVSVCEPQLNRLVLIGTSTGGPRALNEVIPALPANFPAGVLIVQHMPPGFTRSLAERLDNLSAIHVKEAVDGDEVRAGVAYIAPGDYHMVLTANGRTGDRHLFIHLTQDPPIAGHRPSVDVMISSAAEVFWGPVVAVILTGMGQDGTQGVKKLKSRGQSKVIAEDQSTCVVYGMPKAAIESGCVDKVVPLPLVADEIMHMI